MIRIENAGLKWDTWVFRDLNLELKRGEVVGLVGRSGEGKSSLLRAVSGFTNLTEGTIFVNNRKVLGPSVKLVPGHEKVELVDQDFRLDSYHTVEENIREKLLHLPKLERDKRVEELLVLMELEDISGRKAIYISGGEKQRLAIARAIGEIPEVLLLDEPFVHLDTRLKLKLNEHIKQLQVENGITVVIVSHNGEDLIGIVDRLIFLKDGCVSRDDSPINFYENYKNKNEGLLLGPLNELFIGNRKVLFRPEHYHLDPNGYHLQLVHSVKTGPLTFNHFVLPELAGQMIVLTSLGPMADGIKISFDHVCEIE